MPTNRTRRGPIRRDSIVPAWVRRLIEHAEEPELNTEAETAFVGWWFWDERVPGLPPSDSREGQAILARIKRRR